MKLLLTGVLAIVLLVAGTELATAGGQPISGGVVGSGTLTSRSATVDLSRSKGFLMEWANVAPGGTFGWHLHRAAVAVAITRGTLTLYDGSDSRCQAVRYSKGQGFIEPANHVHLARNEGNTTVSLYAIYVGVPAKWRTNPTPLDAVAKSPGNCPSSIH